MRGPLPTTVGLHEETHQALERLARAHGTAEQVVLRARIILSAAAGLNNAQVRQQPGVSPETVWPWRDRWVGLQGVPLDDLRVDEWHWDE